MLKAIFAKDVRWGDEILVSGGKQVSVKRADQASGTVYVLTADRGHLSLGEYDIVGLGHRSNPEGGDEQAMLDQVAKRAQEFLLKRNFSRQDEEATFAGLAKAIEVYELGKSATKA